MNLVSAWCWIIVITALPNVLIGNVRVHFVDYLYTHVIYNDIQSQDSEQMVIYYSSTLYLKEHV